MSDTIQVVCENLGRSIEVEGGSTLALVADRLPAPQHPYLAALVDNRIRELDFRLYRPATVRFIDITSFAGIRVLQRTASFILQKACRDLWPERRLRIRHSMGQNGFYCEVEGLEATAEAAGAIERRMRELAAADLPIRHTRELTQQVRARFAAEGFDDKVALLDTRPRLYSDLCTLDGLPGSFYGVLAPSTRCLDRFALTPYYCGFLLSLPLRTAPERLHGNVRQEKMFDIFREYQSWVEIMGVPTVGAVNARVLAGDGGSLVKLAEAFHERKFALVADAVAEANRTRGVRTVLISGPSSSGKTTSAKRLSIQLAVLGLQPVMISLDDYFVDREKTPRDERGEYDYEALEAIDLDLFNDHLARLMRGQSVDIPRYDFLTGRRTWHNAPLTLDERSILIIEGIHGLNPRLTPSIPDERKFRIYVSCFTSVAMDNLSRIATTDNRLLRRLVRDARMRGADALATLSRWESVRRGEERHIFPYQENADVMLNSSLFYEISVLRPFAEKILREVPDTVPEYDEARRMLCFLDNFTPIAPDEIPPTSILREFIGGSSFTY
ncbi:nucleoside kinase [uncultured Alistipes sp.]|uniref:nucleoside kinase n=1 Tax=uncultured Alistipes sp. TaxID=538949 RepID=UPI0026325D46|nr:nucleoside kinase [uncultured Alistipes sp.]